MCVTIPTIFSLAWFHTMHTNMVTSTFFAGTGVWSPLQLVYTQCERDTDRVCSTSTGKCEWASYTSPLATPCAASKSFSVESFACGSFKTFSQCWIIGNTVRSYGVGMVVGRFLHTGDRRLSAHLRTVCAWYWQSISNVHRENTGFEPTPKLSHNLLSIWIGHAVRSSYVFDNGCRTFSSHGRSTTKYSRGTMKSWADVSCEPSSRAMTVRVDAYAWGGLTSNMLRNKIGVFGWHEFLESCTKRIPGVFYWSFVRGKLGACSRGFRWPTQRQWLCREKWMSNTRCFLVWFLRET